jgi:hypothetical protein
MAATAAYKCKCCGEPFTARVADRNRGWARYCSKRCKAIKQEQQTGQYAAFKNSTNDEVDDAHDWEGAGWDAHKDVF